MTRVLLAGACVAALGVASPIVTPAVAQGATEVAGRPALPTTSVEDVLKMREQWGTAPSQAKK